jgi:glucose-1-phosphate thymidylyltransferase
MILAAGRGERLAGVQPPFAKPLAHVAGRPAVAWAASAIADDVDRLVAVVSPACAAAIEAAIAEALEGSGLPVDICVQAEPKGVAAAVGEGIRRAGLTGPLIVACGDNVMEPGAASAHARRLAEAPDVTMTWAARWLDGRSPSEFAALIDTGGGRRLVEKASGIESAFCWCGPVGFSDARDALRRIEALEPSARGEVEMVDLMNGYIAEGRAEAVPLEGRWFDIGTGPRLAACRAAMEPHG